jgi:hypothetical protein
MFSDSQFYKKRQNKLRKKYLKKFDEYVSKVALCHNVREYLRGKHHGTVDLLFGLLELAYFTNKNKNFQFSYSWFQTSQTGQPYSDTSLVFSA